MANIFDGSPGFDGLQNCDDLVLSELGFTHGDLLTGTLSVCRKTSKSERVLLVGYLQGYRQDDFLIG